MRKIYILSIFLVLYFSSGLCLLYAQKNEWVNQVIIVNGGRFESGSLTDYVTVQKYDPVTHAVTVFDTIYTQSVQDAIIHGNHLFVAAQDTLVEYDLNTYQRLVAIEDSGMSRLGFFNNKLIVTKQYPIVRFFVEILDASNNLGLLARVQFIPGECGGVVTGNHDSIYVAVNGGWQGTTSKLAVINPLSWQLERIVDLDTLARGINDLYYYNGMIYSVNNSVSGGLNEGSITMYNPNNNLFSTYVLEVNVGKSIGIKNNLLYVKFNEGLGSYNLDINAISDTTIIPDPGSALRIFIINGAIDYVNNQLYLNIGDMQSWGQGLITSLTGDSLSSFTEGISAKAIAIDYRTPVSIQNKNNYEDFVSIYPNPVKDLLTVNLTGQLNINQISVSDLMGRILYSRSLTENETMIRINCSDYIPGIYIFSFSTDNGLKTRKIIIN